MAEEQGLPPPYDIKVKNGQVLYKRFWFIYGAIGPLAGAHAFVAPLEGAALPTYRVVVFVPPGIPYPHSIGGDRDAIEQAERWARRFNELAGWPGG